MTRSIAGVTGVLLAGLASAGVAVAHPGDGTGPHGPHGPNMPHAPMWDGGVGGHVLGGGWPWIGWLVSALVVVALVGLLVFLFVRNADARSPPDDGALATLRERYASGEIDEAEFESRRSRLADR